MVKNNGRPWGIEDVLQVQRGLLRAISPGHLITCSEQLLPGAHQQRPIDAQIFQLQGNDKNAFIKQQKALSYDQPVHLREEQFVEDHGGGQLLQAHSQHNEEQKHQLQRRKAWNDDAVRLRRSLVDLGSRKTPRHAASAATAFRPWTAHMQRTTASVNTTAAAGGESIAVRSMSGKKASREEAFAGRQLQRCFSSASSRQIQWFPSQQRSTPHDEASPQQPMLRENLQRHNSELQPRVPNPDFRGNLEGQRQYLPQQHTYQQQRHFVQTEAHRARNKQQEYPGGKTLIRKSLSSETEEKPPLDEQPLLFDLVRHRSADFNVRSGADQQSQLNSAAVKEGGTVAAIARAASNCISRSSGAEADSLRLASARQRLPSAASHPPPAPTATEWTSEATSVPAAVSAVYPFDQKAYLARSHSLQESNKGSICQQKTQQQRKFPLNNLFHQPSLPELPVCVGCEPVAAALPLQASVKDEAGLATMHVADCPPFSQSFLLQPSPTYATFSEIALELIYQQRQSQILNLKRWIHRPALSEFTAPTGIHTRDILSAYVRALGQPAGRLHAASYSRTARGLTTQGSSINAPTSAVSVAAACSSSAELQTAFLSRRNLGSLVANFARSLRFSGAHHRQHQQHEPLVGSQNKECRRGQQQFPKLQAVLEAHHNTWECPRIRGDTTQQERNSSVAASALRTLPQKGEQQGLLSQPVGAASLQPLTTCDSVNAEPSTVPETCSLQSPTLIYRRTSRKSLVETASLGQAAGSTPDSPADSRASAVYPGHFSPTTSVAVVDSALLNAPPGADHYAPHHSVPLASQSASAVAATAAVATTARCDAVDGISSHSKARKLATGYTSLVKARPGAAAAVAAATPASTSITSLSDSSATHATAAASSIEPADTCAPVIVTDLTVRSTLTGALPSHSTSRGKLRVSAARCSGRLKQRLYRGEMCSSGVQLRTLLDVSSYSLDSTQPKAIHDAAAAAALAPGPLLLLFTFYSSIFSYLETGNTRERQIGPHDESFLKRGSGGLNPVESNREKKATSIFRKKSGNENCSDKSCSKREEHAITHISQSNSRSGSTMSSNCSSNSGEGAASSRGSSKGGCYTGSDLIGSSSNTHNYSKSCGDSCSITSSEEKTCNRPSYWCAQTKTSTRRKLPPRVALSRLLQQPICFDDPCFGLLGAREMVKHFSLYLPQFLVSPLLVEELWTVILHTTSTSHTCNRNPRDGCSALFSETAEREFPLPLLARKQTRPAHSISGASLSVQTDLCGATRPLGARASRGGLAGHRSSSQTAADISVTAFANSRAKSILERKPRPATSGVHELASHRCFCTSPGPSVEACTGSVLNLSSKQLQQKRLDFLGFTAFFAAVVTLATKCAFATALSAQQKAILSPPSSLSTDAQISGSPSSSTAGYKLCCPSAAVGGGNIPFASITVGAQSHNPVAAAGDTSCTRTGPPSVDLYSSAVGGAALCFSRDTQIPVRNFQCVQQFMRRFFSTPKAAKQFLLGAYVEMEASGDLLSEASGDLLSQQKPVNDPRRLSTSESGERRIHQIHPLRKGAVMPVAKTRSTTATENQRTEAMSECALPDRSATALSVRGEERNIAEEEEQSRDASKRRTEGVKRSSSLGALVKLRRRCSSVAGVELNSPVLLEKICNDVGVQHGSISMSAPVSSNSSGHTVAPEGTDGFLSGVIYPPGTQLIPSSLALSISDSSQRRHQNARFSDYVKHPFRRYLWSTLPGRGLLQWLLLRYTFSVKAPVWVPFEALFIDMGVQRTVPSKKCESENVYPRAGSTQAREEIGPNCPDPPSKGQRIPKHECVFIDLAPHDATEKCRRQLLITGIQKQEKSRSPCTVSNDFGVRGDAQHSTLKKQQPRQHVTQQGSFEEQPLQQLPQQSSCAQAVCAKAASIIDTLASGPDARRADLSDGPVAVEGAARGHRGAGGAVTRPVETPSAEGTVAAQSSSVNAASCKSAVEVANMAPGEGHCTDSTRGVTPRSSDAAQENSFTKKASSQELAAVIAPATEADLLSQEQLPLNSWRLLRNAALQQQQRARQRKLMLQERAAQKARIHRFAIEADNNTTAPVAMDVELENLPPVKAVAVFKRKAPLLLVPGCSQRILLDIDRTHQPGEWLGFAHIRMRCRRSSSLSGEKRSVVSSACSGENKDTASVKERSKGSNNSTGDSIESNTPGSEAQRNSRTMQARKENYISTCNSRRGDNISKRTDVKLENEWNPSFCEDVVSVPIYLRLVVEHEDAKLARLALPQATSKVALPDIKFKSVAAAPTNTPAASAATDSEVCVQPSTTQKQYRVRQRPGRRLSPLPLHVNRATLPTILGTTLRGDCIFQSTSLCALCKLSARHGASQCPQEKQQGQFEQHQFCKAQSQQQQQHRLGCAASEGDTVAVSRGSLCYSAAFTSLRPQHLPGHMAHPDGGRAMRCAALELTCRNVGSEIATRKKSNGKAEMPPTTSSEKNMHYAGEGTRILSKTIERSNCSSKHCTPDKNSNVDRESSRSSKQNLSQGAQDLSSLTDVVDSIHSCGTQANSLSLSVSSGSSSPSNSLHEDETDFNACTAASLEAFSAGPRLNAREDSFFQRARMLRRLKQMAPDCYEVGQRLVRQQQQQQWSKPHSPGLMPQYKTSKELQGRDADQQLVQYHHLHRQFPHGKWPQHQHIRWLRGHLLYGKNPLESKGWTKQEERTAVVQKHHNHRVSAETRRSVPEKSAKEPHQTHSPSAATPDIQQQFGGKLPWTGPLFYYDSRDNSVFRCSTCGISLWGKFKSEAEEDPLAALRSVIEEELGEASTASCSTSVPLLWSF